MKPAAALAAILIALAAPSPAPAAETLRGMVIQGLQQRLQDKDPIDPSKYVPGAVRGEFSYGTSKEQTLDVYSPGGVTNAPIIVMIHGGGWIIGDKNLPPVVVNKIEHWLPLGFLFVSVDYRLVPEASPDLQAADVAAALTFVEENAPAWGGDPGRIILMGHSAGGHLAALLSANPKWVTDAGGWRWRGTVVLDSAALDVPEIMEKLHIQLYDDAFGTDPAYWKFVSPAAQIMPDAVPMMLICSTLRADAPCKQHEAFADAVAAVTGLRPTVAPQNLIHTQINAELGNSGAYTDTVDAFISARLAD